MHKYREIPPTVSAMQWQEENLSEFRYLNGADELSLHPTSNTSGLNELHLRMFGLPFVLQPWQWLVRQNGVCSVMSNEDFKSKYEPAPAPCV